MGTGRFCENCGQPIGEGEKFCRNCGAPVRPSEGFNQTEETQWADPQQMNNHEPIIEEKSQKTDNHRVYVIIAFVVCIIIALVIGIFIGRSMGNGSETTEAEAIEEPVEPAEESETVEETPETVEEQNEDANEEAEQEEKQQNTNATYSWSVSDDLELTTLEVVSGLEDSTLHATFTNNTNESVVIGWASTAQIDIKDVNGNEYYAHTPVHTEIYASESTKLDLEVSGKIEAEIAEIKVEGVYYVGANGLPTNTAGSTVTYTVN